MGFFQRLFRWGKSEVNSAMDSLEDPIKMTDQGIKDLEEDLEKSIKALATVKASCITAKNDLEKAKQDITDYQNKAMTFINAANAGKMSQEEADKLATQCLEKKSQRSRDLPQLESNYNRLQTQVTKFEDTIKNLKSQIDKWKNEAKMLKARAKVSEATANVNKQLAGIDSTDTISMLEKMKEKVTEQEALADSYLEIAANSGEADIDSAIAQLGGGMEAQNELQALKAQMQGAKAIEAKVDDAKAIGNGTVSELDMLKQQAAQPQAATASADRPMQQADQSPME
ncbi:MAG: PspA/IM30 family protein [Bacteroidales bacterium]|jgi:phage shock protein A|nr:PspA/IM30 family protein [Bacteroidales bacterium]